MSSHKNGNVCIPSPVNTRSGRLRPLCKKCAQPVPKGKVRTTNGRGSQRKVSKSNTPPTKRTKRIICKDCGRSYADKNKYTGHKRNGICARSLQGPTFPSPPAEQAAKLSQKPDGPAPAGITCEDCGRSYSSRGHFREHLRNRTCKLGEQEQLVNGTFYCVFCKKVPCRSCYLENGCSFKTIRGLRMHNALVHHFCKRCLNKFGSKAAFQTHFPCSPVSMPSGDSSTDMETDSPAPVLKPTRKRVRIVLMDSSSESDSELPEPAPVRLAWDSTASSSESTPLTMTMSPQGSESSGSSSSSSPSVLVDETMYPSHGRGDPQTSVSLFQSPVPTTTWLDVTSVPETPPTHEPNQTSVCSPRVA